MALLGLQEVTLSFGGPPLLDRASLAIEEGDRVTLLGRNGTGKSTVLRLFDGELVPDSGEVVRRGGVRVSRLEQDVPRDAAGTMFDVVAGGLGAAGALLTAFHHASARMATDHGDAAMRDFDRLHHAVDAADAWQVHTRVETVLSHLRLEPDDVFAAASGGRKRQALLARALVSQPDVLLLDEPTNHLDVEAIEWMEQYLIDQAMALVFVSHDRAFIRRLATRVVELDRGMLRDWGATYDQYIDRKAAALASEDREQAEFDRKLAREEAWIRTGIKARRTRNEGRVRALERLRAERADRRERTGSVRMQVQEADRTGRIVIEAKHVSFAYGDRVVVRDFSASVLRGDRIGIIGGNGSGKTTLIRLLLGQLEPDTGSVRHGTSLAIAYFDQLREQLDHSKSVLENISDTEFIEIGGSRKHVLGYLQDFLFTPDRARTPVGVLSGGERNRLLLARLFTRSFNVLVLDEPTNDLDMETLDLLEELLLEFTGTLIVVSHDRAFVDNVVSSTLVMEGNGTVGEYVGGYTDWKRQRPSAAAARERERPNAVPRDPAARNTKRRKLSLGEVTELEALPGRIDALERQRDGLFAELADPTVVRNVRAAQDAQARLAGLERDLAVAMKRWEELEARAT